MGGRRRALSRGAIPIFKFAAVREPGHKFSPARVRGGSPEFAGAPAARVPVLPGLPTGDMRAAPARRSGVVGVGVGAKVARSRLPLLTAGQTEAQPMPTGQTYNRPPIPSIALPR
jgi:hypothetical protein